MTWQVLDVKNNDTITVYKILESVVGEERFWHMDSTEWDTKQISYKQEIYFFEGNDGFLKIDIPNYLDRAIIFQKYYPSSFSPIKLDNENDKPTDNLINIDGEWDILLLEEGIGIKEWDIRNSHNSGPRGILVLIDYVIN